MRFEKVILFILIVSSFFVFLVASEEKIVEENVFIERVLDGDTLQTSEDVKIRLKGINTPETNMFFYEEAKNFTEELLENRSAVFRFSETDKYGRELGYVFLEKENVNEKILEEGFGHLYYYGLDEYYEELREAESRARESEKGIWKHSENFGCLEVVEFVYLDLEEDEKEKLILKNNCDVDLFVTIKDDATHIYKEKISAFKNFEKETNDIWNDDGDSMYIWDSEGLVYFGRY
jgi:endonuclease YncB( thermonuclease family)